MTLKATDISFAYGKNMPVLKQISACITPGSFLAILGVNGSGKSTLLSCLDDILRPQSGSITLAGTDITRLTREQRAQNIALVSQHSHAHGVTVYDALLLGRKPYIKSAPTSTDFAAVDKVVDQLDLGTLALRYLDELSGGEYQKVVIARALVQETDVLLLDEPTNNLDMANQVEVMQMIQHVAHEHGCAAAAVLHDINLALRYCDKFLLLNNGEVYAHGGHDVITADAVFAVYGIHVEIINHKGVPVVIPSCPNSIN